LFTALPIYVVIATKEAFSRVGVSFFLGFGIIILIVLINVVIGKL
jgi:hypothetical protein